MICQFGDSGGPVFQRFPPGVNTYTKAIGTIVGYLGTGAAGTACAAERIDYEVAHSNTHLLTG